MATRNTKVKPKFDWERFKNSKERINVHCRTAKEAQNFRRLMHEHGMKWCSGDLYTRVTNESMAGGFDLYKDRTVYDNKGQYGNINYSNEQGWEIVSYSAYDWS